MSRVIRELSEASTLVVGDIHVTPDELDECRALINGIIELRAKHGYEVVVFLGDQFHTHSVLSLQVVAFWRWAVSALRAAGYRQIHLRGNHDMAANGDGPHALEVYRELLDPLDFIVDGATSADGILFIGHHVNEEDFQATIQKMCPGHEPRLVVCHQTFEGAQYENGFYAPDGFDQTKVPGIKIISGHVHRRAVLGKVVYEGSPRWRTKSDAGEAKCVVGYPKGMLGDFVTHDTSAYCTPIEVVEDTEGSSFSRRWVNSKLTVVVKGKPEFVKARAAQRLIDEFSNRSTFGKQ